ncbi:patatin-like phospholipase family protein [Amycolatopsis sp. NPDC021455]|uniref:patatin-like phospholipase family protein n=1 Tax=Amycolatopsis sp. NPDC021455 TaxID=3154901 RepID=UPI0033C52E74
MSESAADDFLGRNVELVSSLRDFAGSLRQLDRVVGGLDLEDWQRTEDLARGRDAVRRLLAGYVETVPERGYGGDARVFGGLVSAAASRGISAVAVALLAGGDTRDGEIAAATRLVVGGDPASQAFRAALVGSPWTPRPDLTWPSPGDPLDPGGTMLFPPPLGDDRIPLDKLRRIECFGGLSNALNELSMAGAGLRRTEPYPGMTIRSLAPQGACAGDTIHVSGSGFGTAEPVDAVVVFRSTPATVVGGSWGPTGFDVIVPAGVGECCVSVLKVPEGGSAGSPVTALSDLAGVLTMCFGAAGIAAGAKLEGLAARGGDRAEAVCAPDGSNRFVGGTPRIAMFRTDRGASSPQEVRPGQSLLVTWSIVNATSAKVSFSSTGNSPFAVTPSLPSWFTASATSGFVTLPAAFGLVPWHVTMTLTASNACGSSSASIELGYSPAPGLVFVGAGAKSSFHLGAIEALGAMPLQPPTVCAGSGLGALSAVCAAADFPAPTSLRTFWDACTGHDAWYVPNPALFVPGGDFAALDNATWQAENRAEVLTLGALDLHRAFLVPSRPSDPRLIESWVATAAGVAADKAADVLGSTISAALKEAGQTALSYVPIVAILYAAAKFAVTAYLDSLKQQTATALATQPSIFDNTKLRNLVTTALSGAAGRVASSGRKIRIPLTGLELGRARYGTDGGALSDLPVLGNIVANVPLGQLVLASVTVPLLGPPVQLGTDHYVDGSVRDPVPIGAAVEAGARAVIVLQPNNRLIPADEDFATAGIPRIDARTSLARDAQFLDAAIETFERYARDPGTQQPVGGWRAPVYVVEPSVQLLGLGAAHSELGLVDIMADYGYLRAYDALVPWLFFPDPDDTDHRARRRTMTAELTASTDKIIGLRVAAWELEHVLNGLRATPFGPTSRIGGGPLVAVPDAGAITEIRNRKSDIHNALVARLAIPVRWFANARPGLNQAALGVLPMPRPRAEAWYLAWESHSYQPVVAPVVTTPATPDGDPWVSLTYGSVWTVPPGTPPPSLPWP